MTLEEGEFKVSIDGWINYSSSINTLLQTWSMQTPNSIFNNQNVSMVIMIYPMMH